MRVLGLICFLSACSTYGTPNLTGAGLLPTEAIGIPLKGANAVCRVNSIIDGDSLRLLCSDGSSENVRLVGFDTPETFRPSCERERALGQRATARLDEIVAVATTLHAQPAPNGRTRDKYNRLLFVLIADGQDVGDLLIRENLARAYDGGRRQSWCI